MVGKFIAKMLEKVVRYVLIPLSVWMKVCVSCWILPIFCLIYHFKHYQVVSELSILIGASFRSNFVEINFDI